MTYYNPYNAPYRGFNTMNPNFSVNLSSFSGGTSSGTGQPGDAQGAEGAEAEEAATAGGGFANAMNKGMAVAGGVMGIYNTFNDLSKIADTSGYWNQIGDINELGLREYDNYDALSDDYATLDSMHPDIDYMKIRGKSDGQRAAGIGSAMIQGAAAGMTFGPYGAAAGAAIGLGAGIAGVVAGNSNARFEKRKLTNAAAMANSNARSNLEAASENLADYKFRSGVSNRAAMGGKIDRRQESIRQFSDRVLRKPRQVDHDIMPVIQRRHCAGGTMIRFKK